MIRRRGFITLLGGAAAAWPVVVRAQSLPLIGMLNGGMAGPNAFMVTAFRQGLEELGYVEGRTVRIEYRWADDQQERLPALASELVRERVRVIAAGPTAAAL